MREKGQEASTFRNLGTLHQHASCSCHAIRGNAIKLHPLISHSIPLAFGFTSKDGAHLQSAHMTFGLDLEKDIMDCYHASETARKDKVDKILFSK